MMSSESSEYEEEGDLGAYDDDSLKSSEGSDEETIADDSMHPINVNNCFTSDSSDNDDHDDALMNKLFRTLGYQLCKIGKRNK